MDWTSAFAIYSPVAPALAASRHLRGSFVDPTGKFPVKLFVTLRGHRPGEILRHRALHQLSPQFPIAKNLSRTLDRVPKGVGRIFVTEKSVAAVRCRIVVLDDFLDSAGDARNRKRAIFQTVHRSQPSRLEPRRNQTDIYSSFDNVRAFFIVDFSVSKPLREFSRRDGERRFVGRIAFAQNDEPNVVSKKSIEQRHQNIETFFTDDARDHSENRAARFGFQSQTI